jgi:hypothetical protein
MTPEMIESVLKQMSAVVIYYINGVTVMVGNNAYRADTLADAAEAAYRIWRIEKMHDIIRA